MNNINSVISFRVTDVQKNLFVNSLGSFGKVTFLKNIPEEKKAHVLSSADVLLAWYPPDELKNIDRKNLQGIKLVQLLSAGYDQLDFEQFSSDCQIACNRGAYAEPMAEYILAMILALSKNLLLKHKRMVNGEFDQLSENRILKNKVCGIIGFGSIGKTSAKLLKDFGTKIYAINSSGKTGDEIDFIGTLNELDFVLKNSDIVVISIPLKKETKNLIGKRELELMKPDGMIINVARGSIINEKDLYYHLKNNQEFLAGIDAWWNEPFISGKFKLRYPFFDLPNLLGSPHNSAIAPGSLLKGAELAIKNVLRFVNGKEVRGIVIKS